MADTPIIVEQVFAAPAEELWRAITDPERMVQWYFDQIDEFQPEEGFSTSFTVTAEGRDFEHLWTVTESVPGRRLRHTWRYAGIAGDGLVTWEVFREGSGSRLRLTCEGIETFPQDDPLFSREACEGGWQYFVCQQLKMFLDGGAG